MFTMDVRTEEDVLKVKQKLIMLEPRGSNQVAKICGMPYFPLLTKEHLVVAEM
jgi:hypothetical protein